MWYAIFYLLGLATIPLIIYVILIVINIKYRDYEDDEILQMFPKQNRL